MSFQVRGRVTAVKIVSSVSLMMNAKSLLEFEDHHNECGGGRRMCKNKLNNVEPKVEPHDHHSFALIFHITFSIQVCFLWREWQELARQTRVRCGTFQRKAEGAGDEGRMATVMAMIMDATEMGS